MPLLIGGLAPTEARERTEPTPHRDFLRNV